LDGQIEDGADGALAGRADEQWSGHVTQLPEAAQHLDALLWPPAKAEAGVHDEPLRGDAGGLGLGAACEETVADIADDVAEGAVALVVHHDDTGARLGSGARDIRLAAEAVNIVDDGCAGVEGGADDGGLGGIDAEGDVDFANQLGDDGDDAGEFVLLADGLEAGAGGLCAEVQDVGALLDHAQALAQGGLGVGVEAVAGEGVVGAVNDAHEERAAAPDEVTPGDEAGCEGDGLGSGHRAALLRGRRSVVERGLAGNLRAGAR